MVFGKKLVLSVFAGFLMLFGGIVLSQEKPPNNEKETLITQAQKILDLVNKLESTDEAERTSAFQSLKEIGPPVIPFLVDKLKDQGVYIELVNQIQSYRPPSPDEIKANLQIWQEIIGSVTDKEVAIIEKYFYSKYLSAVGCYQKEDYQSALNTIKAILELEPRLSFRDKLKVFRLGCEEKLIQQNIIRANLRTPKDLYEIGDKVFITLKLENVTLSPLEITMPSNPVMIINVTYTEYSPSGDFASTSYMQEEKLPVTALNLKPQELWEHTFAVDTSKDTPKSIYYRVYEVTAEIRPAKLKSGSDESIRRIISLPLSIRTFPPDVEKVLKEPIPSLTKALQGGIPIDIFLCALLVPEADKEKAFGLLMKTLEGATPEVKKAIMTTLRHITKIPVELDEKAWQLWWESRTKSPKK